MPKRKRKIYNRPKKIYDSARIAEENELVKRYGLKNKKEIWKADFAISKMRNTAKKLITADEEKKKKFIEMQKERGFSVNSIEEILGLSKEDYLKRRLQSIVASRGIARTPNQARQFITHKHITLNNNIINSPSHITTLKEEDTLRLNISLPVKKGLKEEEGEFLKEIEKEAGKAKKNTEESAEKEAAAEEIDEVKEEESAEESR